MRKRTVGLIGVIAALAVTGGLGLHTYSTQQALNLLALGASETNLRQYSTQEAANLLVQRQTQEIDTLIAHFVLVSEDMNGTVRDSLEAGAFRGFKIGYGVSPGAVDAVGAALLDDLQWMVGAGHELTSGGWKESNEWAELFSNTDQQATGRWDSWDMYEKAIWGGFLGIRDTLGLYTPRVHSYSQSSGGADLQKIVARYFDFATCTVQYMTRTVASGTTERANRVWVVDNFTPSASVLSTVSGSTLAAMPGNAGNRYQIVQCLGDGATFSLEAVKRAITNAIIHRGLVVYLGHAPASSTAGWRAIADFCKTYVDMGVLRVTTPSEAFDYYYGRPIGATADFAHSNFQSWDTHAGLTGAKAAPDEWYGGARVVTGDTAQIAVFPDSVYSSVTGGNSVSGSYRYGHGKDRGYAICTWEDGGEASTGNYVSWNLNVANTPWKSTRAIYYSYIPRGAVRAEFEIWVVTDPTLHTPSSTDTIGLTFVMPTLIRPNVFGLSAPDLAFLSKAGSTTDFIYNTRAGFPASGATMVPPTMIYTLEATDTLNVTGDGSLTHWHQIKGTFDIPANSGEVLLVSVWKDVIPANALWLSDYHMTYVFPNAPGESIARRYQVR